MSALERRRLLIAALVAVVGLTSYVALAACLLRYDLGRLVFIASPAPRAAGGAATPYTEAFRLGGADGATMLLRRYAPAGPIPRTRATASASAMAAEAASVAEAASPTAPVAGCVVFFPGQHGGLEHYAHPLFADLQAAGLEVFAVAYPGQDGAAGHATVPQLQSLGAQAVARVEQACGRTHTVVAGHSLGSTIAAWAAGATHPAGLVLESTSPSFSDGVRAHLRAHWYTRPLALLPLERLVQDDFAVAQSVPSNLHVVIFQGDADRQAPVSDLAADDDQPSHPPIVVVPGGRHDDTFERATPAMIATMRGMINGSIEAAAAGDEDD